jgi:hypothetical protein
MVAGNIGSRRKANYTVLGDSVNLASRLEGATKKYGVGILIGEATYRAAGDGIVARPVDLLQVKGKKHGVAVYELIGLAGTSSAEEARRLERWERAIATYRFRCGRGEAGGGPAHEGPAVLRGGLPGPGLGGPAAPGRGAAGRVGQARVAR